MKAPFAHHLGCQNHGGPITIASLDGPNDLPGSLRSQPTTAAGAVLQADLTIE